MSEVTGILAPMTQRAHVAVYDTLADWETGYLLVELRTGRFTGVPWQVATVAETPGPITTMGGVQVLPEAVLSDLDPADSGLLVLAGAQMWDAGGGQVWVDAARRFLEAGVPVAAICGATGGLACGGLLDERRHTSAAPEYLASFPGYHGQDQYVDARAVVDGDLVTAGPQSPVHFASVTLGRLGLASQNVLDAYEDLFCAGNPAAFGTLMQAQTGS